jgi:hypothetical protein
MQAIRIQRIRTAGYDMQAVSRATNGLDCISVTRPARWGNPYDIKIFGRELWLRLSGTVWRESGIRPTWTNILTNCAAPAMPVAPSWPRGLNYAEAPS